MEIGAALFKTADLVLKLLGSPIVKEIQSIRKYETEIEMLANTVHFIEKVLSDVDGKQLQGNSVIEGYKRLRVAFLDAEDFLDRLETLKKLREADGRNMKKTRRFFSKSNQAKYAVEVHNAIKKIRENLDAIVQDLQKFGLKELSTVSEASPMTARATGSYVDAARITGRDEDKKAVVELLRSSSEEEKIPMILIVGMGGLGKTTLAQLVYHDKGWQEGCMFDMKMWVSDSKKFTLKTLLKKILKSISPTDNSLDNLEEDHLVDRLLEGISGKRFLLVIDDVETDDLNIWNKLEGLLNTGNKEGSRILLTTRSRELANVIGSSASTYPLSGLSDESSWGLFEAWAFLKKEGNAPKDLIEIGKLIVEKCKGVPLAIIVAGSLLRGKDRCKWQYVRDVGFAELKEESNQVMPILKISYDNLDYTLKQCFSYCALFPKNVCIPKETLRDIWIENVRFKTKEALEDVCYNNMEILYNRCFLEAVKMEEWEIRDVDLATDDDGLGAVYYFKMHDLMHDLAKEVAGAEMLVLDSNVKVEESSFENVRHLSFIYDGMKDDESSPLEFKGKQLRTFLQVDTFIFGPKNNIFSVAKMVSDCPVLRMLDLHRSGIRRLTNSMGKLIQLRHLDLSWNGFETLPDSITELINLRHLYLVCCMDLRRLPSGMGKLTSLEVLDISRCEKLEEVPMDIEKLIMLRYLKLAGCEALTCLPFKMEALTQLKVFDISDCSKLERLPMGIEKLINLRRLDWEHCNGLTCMPSGMGALMSVCSHPRFMVGYPESKDTAQLEELGLLSELVEYVEIEIPKKLMLKESGDGEAFVLNKRCLRKLHIKWNLKDKAEKEEEVPENHMDILAKLQPPPNLKELRLTGYEGVNFPVWMSNHGFASVLPNLVKLDIRGCERCQHLPRLSRLPLLKRLTLDSLNSLEFIEEDNIVSTGTFYPSLENLFLYDLPKLKGWCRGVATSDDQYNGHELPSFPAALNKVEIEYCPKFRVEANLFSSVKMNGSTPTSSVSFLVQVCTNGGRFHLRPTTHVDHELVSLTLENLNLNPAETPLTYMADAFRGMSDRLTSLEFDCCLGLKSLPGMKYLTALRKLSILDCCDFTWEDKQSIEHQNLNETDDEMSWRGLKSLTELTLQHLPEMVKLPEGIQFVTSLEKLTLKALPKMATLPEGIQFLNSLTNLTLIDIPKMTTLPEGIQFLTSLTRLTLTYLPKMATLPEGIQFVTSLEELVVRDCANFTLPKWIHKTFRDRDSPQPNEVTLVRKRIDDC